MRCSQCSTELVAPVRSEYWSDRHACHVWLCSKCNICFESLVSFPAEPMRDAATGSMRRATKRLVAATRHQKSLAASS